MLALGRRQCRSITCLIAFWKISTKPSDRRRHRAADCRRAHGCEYLPPRRRAGDRRHHRLRRGRPPDHWALVHALSRWWRTMDDLAQRAPESVEATASRMGDILSAGNIHVLREFVAAGSESGGRRQAPTAGVLLRCRMSCAATDRAGVGRRRVRRNRAPDQGVRNLVYGAGRRCCAAFRGEQRPGAATPRRNRGAADPHARKSTAACRAPLHLTLL